MRGDRSRNLLAWTLASAALGLVLWWAWRTLGPEDESAEESARRLPASWFEEPAVPPPAPGPELRPAAAPPGKPTPPPTPPPERIVPETLPVPPEVPRPAEPVTEPDVAIADASPRRSDFRSDAWRRRLLGGVARTSSRATDEVVVPGGIGWIGTPLSWVNGLEGARGADAYALLRTEAPRHRVEFEEFLIDRFETRNHDWLVYLNSTARVIYNTSQHPSRTLAEIVDSLAPGRPQGEAVLPDATRQLYEANQSVLARAFDALLVTRPDGTVDEEASFARIAERPVPSGLRLVFYDRLPPGTWPGAIYADGRIDHPVRDVSLQEAVAYALHRGRFLPTEQQWEYAARGRDGWDYPWSPRGESFEKHVNGGSVLERGRLPDTHPVAHHGGGASWVGAFNLLGNVAEWTGSVLEPYPGALPFGEELAALRLPVVRGGSARVEDRYALRPALRGWERDDPDGAPRADHRRLWTGVRTARYEEPARSRVPIMHLRARLGARLHPDVLEPRLFEGIEGRQFTVYERVAGEDPRTKPPAGVKAIVLQPLRFVARRGAAGFGPNADPSIASQPQLLGASHAGPVLLGLLHTDVHVVGTWADAEALHGGGRLVLRRSDTPPGTYYVALVRGHVALLRTDFAAAWFPSNREPPEAVLNVLERGYRTGAPRQATLRLSVRGTRADLELMVPLHVDAEPAYAARCSLRLDLDPLEMKLVSDWKRGRILR